MTTNTYQQNKFFSAAILRVHYLAILAVAAVLFLEYGLKSLYWLIPALVAYIALYELFLYKSRKTAHAAAQTIISMLDPEERRRLDNFPIPVMVTADDGTLIWQSELFIDRVGEPAARGIKNVANIDEALTDDAPYHRVAFENRHYDVYTDEKATPNGEATVRTYYFIDVTEACDLADRFDDQRPVVAHVLIDNYDELFSGLRETDKAQALTQIYDTITAWAAETNGLLIKSERDRFIFIFDNKVLKSLSEVRFTILDKAKSLQLGLKTFPTLSIGIGMDGNSYSGNDDFARMAIDMALSRGGDQAVIKVGDKYEFFGGTSKASEKRTKIKARVIASAIRELFKTTSTVYIMGHKFADLDSLGSCVGFYRIATSQGKRAKIVLDENSNLAVKLSEQLKLSGQYENVFISPAKALEEADSSAMTVITDTHRQPLVMAPDLIGKTKSCIVIDHHRRSVDYITGTDVFFHDPAASSACEMVTEIIQYIPDCAVTKLEAEALMAGICLDTKFFTIRTSDTTFEASVFLKKAGANTVNVKMLFQTDTDTYKDKVALMVNAEIYASITAIAVWPNISTDNGKMRIVASQAADDLLNIENVHAAFTLFEDGFGSISVSARSYGVINVQLIMEDLGGGGHQTMSGAQLTCSMEEAVEQLRGAIDKYLSVANIKYKPQNDTEAQ